MCRITPVSYTHLDVYKRQALMKPLEFVVVLLCVLLGLGRGADLAFATDAATGLYTAGAVWWRYLASVSYTHLDVYKRQRHARPESPRSKLIRAVSLGLACVCLPVSYTHLAQVDPAGDSAYLR